MSVINTNITALIGQQNLNRSASALQTAMERLSSGLRINSAKDDAAGQAIANRMSSQISGLLQAQRNANDGISMSQTAEGALNKINDNLQRIRELTVQAANGTNSNSDLESIQSEIGQRLEEINRISEETSFNGTKVLDETRGLKIQVGAYDGESITINLKQINQETLGLTGFNVDGSGVTENTAATADDLVLGGFTAGAVNGNGTTEYSKTEVTANSAATVADVLGHASTGDTVTAATTNNGTGVPANGTYTYDGASNSFSFDADNVNNANTIGYLTQGMEVGEMRNATVNIGGTDQEISYDQEGNIFAADDGAVLYLDETGNLTKNSAGAPPAATLESLTASMNIGAGSDTNPLAPAAYTQGDAVGSITESAVFTFSTLAEGESITIAGRTLTATGAMTDAQVASAFAAQFGTGTDASVGTTGEAGSYTMTGTTAGDWSAGVAAGNALTFTSTTPNIDVADITATITTLGGPTGGTITANGATLTANGANNSFDIAGATISAAALASQLTNGDSINIDYDGAGPDPAVSYVIGAGGAITVGTDAQYVQGDGSLGKADKSETTTTYYAHADGGVTDDTGAHVYLDESGNFTFDATTPGSRTENPLDALDNALKAVDSLRSDLGALQNRFESAIDNLSTTATNLSAARSRIEDADYAVEVGNMTRAQILQQAGTSVLAQANQVPQTVLSLLR